MPARQTLSAGALNAPLLHVPRVPGSVPGLQCTHTQLVRRDKASTRSAARAAHMHCAHWCSMRSGVHKRRLSQGHVQYLVNITSASLVLVAQAMHKPQAPSTKSQEPNAHQQV